MNPLRPFVAPSLLSILALLALTVPTLSCSSKKDPPVNGAAFFNLQNVTSDPENPGRTLACSSARSGGYTIAAKDPISGDVLYVDGARTAAGGTASVSCEKNDTRYRISITDGVNSFVAFGTLEAKVSTSGFTSYSSKDTDVYVTIPGGGTYKTNKVKCIADPVDANKAWNAGEIYMLFSCAKLDNSSVASDGCAVLKDIDPKPKFRFTNCVAL